jgi:SAM-dependent methyltransferase
LKWFEAVIATEEKKARATSPSCPACQKPRPRSLGSVASRNADYGFADGGELFECPDCFLIFLEKPARANDVNEMYEDLPANLLPENTRRRDFDLALEVTQAGARSLTVLDVGCFRGDFLQLLPDSVTKFGIEPSREARQMMAERGIQLLGETIDTATAPEARFDFIYLMDVAEHLPNPLADIQKLARWLKPGGKLIITTGNSDALPWRLSRLSYWYYLPQHLSFCNRRWFAWAAKESGLRLVRSATFSHSRQAYGKLFVPERWKQFLKIILGTFSERLTGRRMFPHAVGTATWPDHIFVVLQRGE